MALSFCHYLRKWRPRFVILTSPTRLTNEICGCSSMARVPAFQAGYAGSIPVTRSIDSKMTPSLRGVILLSMHWSLESGGAQRRLPSQVILDCEPHHRWNSWYRSYCNVRRRFSSLGRHRFAVVSLTRQTSVAATPHRDWSHLALQLRNAHHRNLGCGQSPFNPSASCLADVAHAERIGSPHMGMVVFSSSQIVCVRRLARVRHTICCSASRDLF